MKHADPTEPAAPRCDMTAVVLTKDEAANLPRCIQSLSWCRDVVVVDSGSVDATVEVARSLGARVFTHVQPPPFLIATQRNWALDHAKITSAWVVFLDADEVIPRELAARLCALCRDERSEYVGYELTPRYLFWGRWLKRTQGYPNWHARVARLGKVRFAGGVWEHFEPGSSIGRISEPYDHYANSKGFSDWLARHDRYSTWDAKKISDFLASGDPAALGTGRKLRLRVFAARLFPFRPAIRFIYMYFIRLGFTEGYPAFMFCSMYFMYEWMTVIKVIEARRRHGGRAL